VKRRLKQLLAWMASANASAVGLAIGLLTAASLAVASAMVGLHLDSDRTVMGLTWMRFAAEHEAAKHWLIGLSGLACGYNLVFWMRYRSGQSLTFLTLRWFQSALLVWIAGMIIAQWSNNHFFAILEKDTPATHLLDPRSVQLELVADAPQGDKGAWQFEGESLRPGLAIRQPQWPFSLRILRYYEHAVVGGEGSFQRDRRGFSRFGLQSGRPENTEQILKLFPGDRMHPYAAPGALVEITPIPADTPLRLVVFAGLQPQVPAQEFSIHDQRYQIALRFRPHNPGFTTTWTSGSVHGTPPRLAFQQPDGTARTQAFHALSGSRFRGYQFHRIEATNAQSLLILIQHHPLQSIGFLLSWLVVATGTAHLGAMFFSTRKGGMS
jgi:hypothetical protein